MFVRKDDTQLLRTEILRLYIWQLCLRGENYGSNAQATRFTGGNKQQRRGRHVQATLSPAGPPGPGREKGCIQSACERQQSASVRDYLLFWEGDAERQKTRVLSSVGGQ